MDWKQSLRKRLEGEGRPAKRSEQELKDEEMELFTKFYTEWKGSRKSGGSSILNIPRFYYRLPQLDGLEKSFYSFYVCTAVRKFFFFLDPLRTGKIKIQDILACSFLDDLLELRDEELSKESQESNWFSAPSALRVYGQYLNLDKDHNGMLSKEELSRYGTGTLTNVLLDRVFQECLTYDGEMAIQEQMKVHNQEPVSFHDVKDEIFDMVKPKDPFKITLQDLIQSGQGDTVSSILMDLNGFWSYENREVLVANDNDSSADPDDS